MRQFSVESPPESDQLFLRRYEAAMEELAEQSAQTHFKVSPFVKLGALFGWRLRPAYYESFRTNAVVQGGFLAFFTALISAALGVSQLGQAAFLIEVGVYSMLTGAFGGTAGAYFFEVMAKRKLRLSRWEDLAK